MNWIDVSYLTEKEKIMLIKKAYELSRPQGLGMLHFMANDQLTDKEAQSFIREDGTVGMDYVKGRACKFDIVLRNKKLYLPDNWYDHTNAKYQELLKTVNISLIEKGEHGVACNCDDCRKEKGLETYDPQKHFEDLFY